MRSKRSKGGACRRRSRARELGSSSRRSSRWQSSWRTPAAGSFPEQALSGRLRCGRVATVPAIDARIRRYFLFQVLWSFELWHPFWTLWLLQNLRNEFFSATLVDVVFWVVGLLVAMPAGALADRPRRQPAPLVWVRLLKFGGDLFRLPRC